MAEKESGVKSLFFKMPAWQILLFFAALIILVGTFAIQFLTLKVPGGAAILVSIFFIITISFNGNSVMNEGGLDIASLLHFGITLIFGIIPGFLTVLISTAFSLYLSKIGTPIDFFIQKNTMKIWIQTAHLFFTTLFLWFVISIYGIDFIFSKIMLIYILAFTAGRIVKVVLLATIGRVPPMKILGGTVIFYLVNWYLFQFFGAGFLNFLQNL